MLPLAQARAERREATDARTAPPPALLSRYGPGAIAVALLIATAAAFLVAERLKLERSPVQGTRVTAAFSPVCDCSTNVAAIVFRLRGAERVRIDVVRKGAVVRELLVSQRLGRGRHAFTWNGRDAAGALAPDGVYHVRLHLSRGRTITLPNAIALDTQAPVVRAAKPAYPPVFSPDGDGYSDGVRLPYRLSEPGHARLYVDGKLVIRGHAQTTTGQLVWYGRSRGVPYVPGRYRLVLGAVDLAGNLAQQTPAGTVRLRFVALARRVYRVAAGRRFTVRVSADAHLLSYRLARRTVRGGRAVRLRAPARPGRYRLVVTEHGHRARGLVIVRRHR
jgi:hypothetical protein